MAVFNNNYKKRAEAKNYTSFKKQFCLALATGKY